MADTMTVTAPVETVTPILPSEALRLGRLVYPKEHAGGFTDGAAGACGLGAMLAGWGLPLRGRVDDEGMPLREDEADNDNYFGAERMLRPYGISVDELWRAFDGADTGQGDAAVLAYLAERGL